MKRVPALRDLSDDHHTGLLLARRCRQAGRPDSALSPERIWAQVVAAFSDHLEPHFRIEEAHLVPALEAIGETPMAERIRDDHRTLRTLEQSGTVDRDLLARFGECLDAHIRYEEREVFESTQHRLPAAALEAIAAACRTAPRGCAIELEEG